MVATEAYSGMPLEDRQAMYQQVGQSLPVGRIGQAEEIAQGAIMLMANQFATGTVLDIDGGHLSRA